MKACVQGANVCVCVCVCVCVLEGVDLPYFENEYEEYENKPVLVFRCVCECVCVNFSEFCNTLNASNST